MKQNFLAPLLLLSALASNAVAPRRAGHAAVLSGDFAHVHDPSRVLKCNGKYFLYHTGENVPMKYSADLVTWRKGPPVLEHVPDWARKAVPGARGNFIWAPDVIQVGGKYLLFWSFSTFGSRTSVTGLLSSPTLDPESPSYKWTDEGQVLATTDASDYNAIDPAPILDNGELWLAIGSWQRGGIKLVRLDNKTGKPASRPITLAAGQGSGPEAAYLHSHGGWLYLFENEGNCCRGMDSTYNIRVGRSKSIAGPYLDRDGRDLARGGGTLFAGSDGQAIGPGHVGIFSENGVDRLTFHYYDSRANGVPTLGMRALSWSADGWPRIAPEPADAAGKAAGDALGGRYAIVSAASGLALGIHGNRPDDGTPIDQFELRGGTTQQWNVSPLGGGLFAIGSIGTGKYLDVFECSAADGAKVSQYAWGNNGCQKWRAEPVGDGSFRVVCQGSGTALTLPDGTKTPQALVVASAWKGETGQKWIFKKLP